MTGVSAPGPHGLTEGQIDRSLERFADGFARQLRSPVRHWPDEAGLAVSFPALDGVPLPHAYGMTTRDNMVRPTLQHRLIKEIDAVSARPTVVTERRPARRSWRRCPGRL